VVIGKERKPYHEKRDAPLLFMMGRKDNPQNIFDNLASEDYKFEKEGVKIFTKEKRCERKKSSG
jgi:hypothetical protein